MTLNNEELLGFERDDLHREVHRHQRGRETTSQYDPVGRLIAQHSQQQQRGSSQGTTVQGAAGQGNSSAIKRRWQYADNGLLTATDDSLRGTTRYGYDALGRLRQTVSPLVEEHFAFDPAGNLVESDRQGSDASGGTQATRWTQERPRDDLDHTPESRVRVDFPNAPKLSSAMGNLLKCHAGTHYHYDTYGNLTCRIEPNGQTWHYQYDAEHRMVEASRYAHVPVARRDATSCNSLAMRMIAEGEYQEITDTSSIFARCVYFARDQEKTCREMYFDISTISVLPVNSNVTLPRDEK